MGATTLKRIFLHFAFVLSLFYARSVSYALPPDGANSLPDHKGEATPPPAPQDPSKQLDELFKDPTATRNQSLSGLIEKPRWMWELTVGWAWPDMATGFPSFGTQFSAMEGFWSHTYIAVELYGLTNVLLSPGGQYTFFLLSHRLRVQPRLGVALFLGGDYVLNSWANTSTIGINTGMSIVYNVTASWGIVLSGEAPIFFPDGVKLRPNIALGYSHSFF